MVLFFIAFFGIIYYVVKISGEVVRENASKNSHQVQRTKKEEWIRTYTNIGLEQELSEFISKNREAAEKETKEAYDAIYAMFKYIQAHSSKIVMGGWGIKHEDILRIMLAQRGYLRYDDALCGAAFVAQNICSGEFSPHKEWDVVVVLWCTDEIWRVRGDFCQFLAHVPGKYGWDGINVPAISLFANGAGVYTTHLGWDWCKVQPIECYYSFAHQNYLMNRWLQAEREHKEIGVKELNEIYGEAAKVSFPNLGTVVVSDQNQRKHKRTAIK